jgi:hypothetical protein
MANIHVGQTNVRLTLETLVDLTGATLSIRYKKPNKDEGAWSASLGTDADTSTMYYDISSSTDLDQNGEWIFWSHAIFGDGTIGKGEAVEQVIKAEGQI